MRDVYHTKWGKTIYVGSVSFLLGAVVVLSIYLYWALTPYTVLEIKKNPIPVAEKTIKSGGVQILDIDFCKYQDIRGKVNVSLVSNKIVVFLPSYTDTTPAGCMYNLRAPIILPYIGHHDIYHLHYQVTYVVNPIRTSVVEFDTQKFEILSQ